MVHVHEWKVSTMEFINFGYFKHKLKHGQGKYSVTVAATPNVVCSVYRLEYAFGGSQKFFKRVEDRKTPSLESSS